MHLRPAAGPQGAKPSGTLSAPFSQHDKDNSILMPALLAVDSSRASWRAWHENVHQAFQLNEASGLQSHQESPEMQTQEAGRGAVILPGWVREHE